MDLKTVLCVIACTLALASCGFSSKFNTRETSGIKAVKDICDRSKGQLGVAFTVSKTITHGDTFTIQCLLPAGAEVKLEGLD